MRLNWAVNVLRLAHFFNLQHNCIQMFLNVADWQMPRALLNDIRSISLPPEYVSNHWNSFRFHVTNEFITIQNARNYHCYPLVLF